MTAPATRLRLLLLQHAREGTPGLIGEAMAARGVEAETRLPHEGEPLPASPVGFDGLVLMGGLMSATDDHLHPHFAELMDLIRAFPAAGRPVLGVCLGAQLIARTWGGQVVPHGMSEFGYVPLAHTPAAKDDPLLAGLPERMTVMQWHNDTFELPPEASLLLEGAACRNQALRVGPLVYGFQCHFEVTEDMVRAWSRAHATLSGLEPAPLMARLESELAAHGPACRHYGRHIAERWLDLVAQARRRRAEVGAE